MTHLRKIVERIAQEEGSVARPKLRAAYQAIAGATGLKEEYVYQLYTGVKKKVGDDAASKIERAYGDGRPPGWMDMPPTTEYGEEAADEPRFEPMSRPGIEVAIETLAEVLLALNEDGRAMASTALSNLARNPDRSAKAAETLAMLTKIHPRDPDPSRPLETVGAGASAPATRARPGAKLTVKAGGGQRLQLNLPLQKALNPERDPFDEKNAPANERNWYARVKGAPKAKK